MIGIELELEIGIGVIGSGIINGIIKIGI